MYRDLERVSARYGAVTAPEILPHNPLCPDIVTGRVNLPGLELIFLLPLTYPATPPVVLVTADGHDTEQIATGVWRLDLPPDERLLHALEPFLEAGAEPYHKAFGPMGGPALTSDSNRAEIAGWQPIYTGRDPAVAAETIRQGLFARSTGILANSLTDRRVLVVGAGSGGGHTAEQLVRSGVGGIVLIDPDEVEPANLSRTVYNAADTGRTKVRALARRLLSINPLLDLTLYPADVRDLNTNTLLELISRTDLVMAATDDLQAQRLLGHASYAQGKPMIAGGLYAGARGGEIILSVPERTACYHCATRARSQAETTVGEVSRTTDYGTGRLVGEMALGVDIQHVAGASVKMALALLLAGRSEARLATFLESQIAAGATYAVFSMSEDFWFFPRIFDHVPGQYAWQCVWMHVERQADCPVCGDPAGRMDPRQVVPRPPKIEDILSAMGGSDSTASVNQSMEATF